MCKKIDLDSYLIDEFRELINEESFFYNQLSNKEGKNHWNVLCSAMDWINTAAEGLPTIELKSNGFGYNHKDTINLMQYIITIDVMVESIIQLYRVLDPKKPYPLKGSKEIFNHNKLSDDIYFKHLRAVFSTHPVNLKSLDGVISEDGEKFYASWVYKGIENDFAVSLYSNLPDRDKTNSLGINISDLNKYSEKRYRLLEQLKEKASLIKKDHLSYYKSRAIQTAGDSLEDLKILFEENKKRFGSKDGYASLITYLYNLLKVRINGMNYEGFCKEIVENYRTYLKSLISEIKDGLQEMIIKEINLTFHTYEYEFEKIYTYLYTGEHLLGETFYNNLCNKLSFPSAVCISKDMNLKHLFLDAYLFNITKEEKQTFSYPDFF
ncbi:hypothetical protein GCM10010954_14560 [Halobacillus andaensis]|uniref:Uncharacterized protein n=1 Tax=Halobacillus andaensis TaxID=1176239 RepID=A0A917B394_HALAA|nr:hypothetical protein [Halobacillus andaensis]MBP2004259.1 hypothetical protein [Halobacillus andaensis]GGF16986.1 hypothetical protein GCM10010954_14560 [Halobacillus andaensis]